MKRLLLPLLAALALPTAVNAFPDIVQENLAGEKIVVKEKNSQVYDYGYFILNTYYEEALPYLRSKIKTASKKDIEKDACYFSTKLSKAYCEKRKTREGLKSVLADLEKYQLIIDEEIAEKNYKEIHYVKIKYQPIFIDLNRRKSAMSVEETQCINPKISIQARNAWNEMTRSWYRTPFRIWADRTETALDKKVCRNYFSKLNAPPAEKKARKKR